VSRTGAKKKHPPKEKKKHARKPRERPLQLSEPIDFDVAIKGLLAVQRPRKH
jgi:hypothetical protein